MSVFGRYLHGDALESPGGSMVLGHASHHISGRRYNAPVVRLHFYWLRLNSLFCSLWTMWLHTAGLAGAINKTC